jgi:CRISPR-associated protein Csb1
MTRLDALTLDVLQSALRERAAAFRVRTRLQPAGGVGDKVFPPTYAGAVYAFETRRLDGREVQCVLLDSVASQANRMEEALRSAWEQGRLALPMIQVSFSDGDGGGLVGLSELTVLDAPHRIADALLRDSFLDGRPFRFTEAGEALTKASWRDVSELYRWSPTALVFGVWDSTGPRGGLGVKFPRALVSEIVGIDVVAGVKTASRIDPAGIEIKAATLYRAAAGPEEEPGGWVLDPEKAVKGKKGSPEPVTGAGKDKGKPSAVNHGNVAPSVDKTAGGVTMEHALQTTVLSLTALRRLRFPRRSDGGVIASGQRFAAEIAARAALAALGLAAVTLAREEGYYLRSRCHLVPESSRFAFERVDHDGEVRARYELDGEGACRLVAEAATAAEEYGLCWEREPVVLRPAEKLVELIRRSQAIKREEGVESQA